MRSYYWLWKLLQYQFDFVDLTIYTQMKWKLLNYWIITVSRAEFSTLPHQLDPTMMLTSSKPAMSSTSLWRTPTCAYFIIDHRQAEGHVLWFTVDPIVTLIFTFHENLGIFHPTFFKIKACSNFIKYKLYRKV